MFINCKNCGSEINIDDNQKVVTCDFCNLTQVVPSKMDENLIERFNIANKLRREYKFSEARSKYDEIIKDYPNDSEPYWCAILCDFGIEYTDDIRTGSKIATCHRTITKSIFEHPYYKLVLDNASDEEKNIYVNEAKYIDKIQKEIINISKKQEKYDVFICYKEKETNNEYRRTKDAQIATLIYDKLIKMNLKVFYAPITLHDKAGEQFEPFIYSALQSSKLMILIGTSVENLQSPWVRNEWSRFLELANKDLSKRILPIIAKMNIYDLPQEISSNQALDFDDIDFDSNFTRIITSKFNLNNKQNTNTNTNKNNDDNKIFTLIDQLKEEIKIRFTSFSKIFKSNFLKFQDTFNKTVFSFIDKIKLKFKRKK